MRNPHWIAQRILTDAAGRTACTVQLSEPVREPDGYWCCLVQLAYTADGTSRDIEAHGSDSVQALRNGFAAISQELAKGEPLSWLMAPGDSGFGRATE